MGPERAIARPRHAPRRLPRPHQAHREVPSRPPAEELGAPVRRAEPHRHPARKVQEPPLPPARAHADQARRPLPQPLPLVQTRRHGPTFAEPEETITTRPSRICIACDALVDANWQTPLAPIGTPAQRRPRPRHRLGVGAGTPVPSDPSRAPRPGPAAGLMTSEIELAGGGRTGGVAPASLAPLLERGVCHGRRGRSVPGFGRVCQLAFDASANWHEPRWRFRRGRPARPEKRRPAGPDGPAGPVRHLVAIRARRPSSPPGSKGEAAAGAGCAT